MAETKIEWTHTPRDDGTYAPGYTFNSWIGCTEVSAACDFCYARTMAKRRGWAEWGNHPRHLTSESYWRQPLKWNREADASGERRKVFCASLADVFDNQVSVDWRADLWALIANTPYLDWLLLTKRPQNIGKMLPGSYVEQLVGHDLPWPWSNVWIGMTAENQQEYDRRWPQLAAVPATVRFVSYEPALGPLMISKNKVRPDWVIFGGESGPGRRPVDLEWGRDLRDECVLHGVAFYGKQWDKIRPLPDDLMLRQFPMRPYSISATP
jgi:protein gp37